MLRSNDSKSLRRSWRIAATAVVLLAAGWARVVSAAGVPGRIGVDSVSALAIDPHTPATLYAVGVCGTAVKSTDGGDNWIVANTGLPNFAAAIAIDPITPSTLYAAKYECCGAVFKSTDSARTWSAANTGLPDRGVNAIAIDPVTPNTLYVGTDLNGVFKSTDGARTWSAVNTGLLDTNVGVLAIDPTTPRTLYAGTYGGASSGSVFKSADAATTWDAAGTGVTTTFVYALAIDPITPRTLYAGTQGRGVFKSSDAGATWGAANAGPTDGDVPALAIDPITPNTLYAGTYGADASGGSVFKSTDAGSTWSAVNTGLPDMALFINALAIDPVTPSTLYVGTYVTRCCPAESVGAVFKSTDSARSWQATGLEAGPICGDGIRCGGEECDDGNLVDGDGCDANCTATRCGNGIVSAGEQCDDGNLINGDGCDANCTPTACGNGITTCGEECDDGNLINGDGCDANCTVTRCGNGIVTAGEECDDGNTNPADGCTNACTICGNGVVTPPEECDDGNTNPADGCTNACTSTICGDGIVTPPEECDDGNLVNGDGCDANCHSGCGNGVLEGDEECDDGGICIGSANAGTRCAAVTDCPGGHCQTFGGDGCAANCTLESDVPFNLAPGILGSELEIAPATSGAVIHGYILTIPLPFSGSQTLTIGKERDGHIPVVIKADSVRLPRIPLSTVGCACLRPVAVKTCGGTMFEPDGVTQSPDCTPGFTAGDSVCAGKNACAFLHGPGNSASGVIGCNGLDGVNVSLTQDSGGSSGTARPPRLTLSGTGGSGSAVLSATTATSTRVAFRSRGPLSNFEGLCAGQEVPVYGADGEFCTDDDPQSQRGTPVTALLTTGTVSGKLLNANMTDGDTICDYAGGNCGPSECRPFSATGHPFTCSALAAGSASGAVFASVSVELATQTVGDVVTTNLLVEGRPAPSPTPSPGALVGDCHGDGQVTVDELLTMVNIVLGTAQLPACPPITTWAAGTGVNVTLVVQAVSNALSGRAL